MLFYIGVILWYNLSNGKRDMRFASGGGMGGMDRIDLAEDRDRLW